MSATAWSVCQALAAAAGVSVYAGRPDPGAALPYVVLGSTAEDAWDRFCRPGGEVRVTIHAWAASRARAEALYATVHDAWEEAHLTLDGGAYLLRGTMRRISDQPGQVDASLAHQIIAEYRANTE